MNTLPNPLHGDWVDSMADWSVSQKTLPIPLLTAQPFGGCDCSLGLAECQCMCRPMPRAEACTDIGVEPENLSGLPLEPYLNRHKWLGPLLVALIGFVWLCADGYLENLPK